MLTRSKCRLKDDTNFSKSQVFEENHISLDQTIFLLISCRITQVPQPKRERERKKDREKTRETPGELSSLDNVYV